MKVVSVNIGKRELVPYKGKFVETGIFKNPVNYITLQDDKVLGDAVIDKKYHGGKEQAVYAYADEHYSYWKKMFPEIEFSYGIFGENITISGLDEKTIRVGDKFKIGTALVEATKSREPCYKLGIRVGDFDIVSKFWQSTKCGVYFKILENGVVKPEDKVQLISSSKSSLTIAEYYETKKPTIK